MLLATAQISNGQVAEGTVLLDKILALNPRDIPALVKEIQPYKIHVLPAVNTLFNALANHPEFIKLDFSGLRVSAGGGMDSEKDIINTIRSYLHQETKRRPMVFVTLSKA